MKPLRPGASRHCGDAGREETHIAEHRHTQTKAVVNRLSRAIGHLESIRKMVEEERDCADILIQLAAVQSALGSASRVILKDHIEHCLVHAVESRDDQAIDDLNRAIDHLLK
ncbi:MAG: metal-sensing transcriptional repressor [Oscillospiraceae bacterium]|nr:metal-sensing transcriptional repressor [Oscillospiraceae bacterium]